jgi:prephenate dehydrogenase
VLANVLVAQAAAALGGERLPAIGPSFRDATRVAGAPSAIWTDIYLSNRDALIAELDGAIERLREVRSSLAGADAAGLTAWNEAAAADRRRLVQRDLAGAETFELRVSVPNRPGLVARVALKLGDGGVNIADMALYPADDRSTGVIALWIAGEDAAARATALIEDLGFPVARP